MYKFPNNMKRYRGNEFLRRFSFLAENKDLNASHGDEVNRETLTTRQGHPVRDNQNIRTIGNWLSHT